MKSSGLTMFSWRYLIRIENFTGSYIRFLSQTWKIHSLTGLVEEVTGQEVIGEDVTMDDALPTLQYSSYVNLTTPYGYMSGSFRMEKQGCTKFYCRVPDIVLDSKGGLEEMPC